MATNDLGLADDPAPARKNKPAPWKILVVDDDQEVHDVTRLALNGLKFLGRDLEFLNAYSGAEACQTMRENPDIALVLLDVVMETDSAGLDTVEFIRNELGNKFVRIVLRTGQPGQAPEIEVISRYDINDYKQKTELTRERLFTTIYTGLAAYRDLRTLETNLHGLEKVVEASGKLFELSSMQQFAQGVLEQLTALLYLDEGAVMLRGAGVALEDAASRLSVIAAVGRFRDLLAKSDQDAIPPEIRARLKKVYDDTQPLFDEQYILLAHHDPENDEHYYFYLECSESPDDNRRMLVESFFRNVALAIRRVREDDRRRAAPAA